MIDYDSVSRRKLDMTKTAYLNAVKATIDASKDPSEKEFYKQFLNINVDNKEELNEAIWALNKGKLRDEYEIEQHKEQIEQYKRQFDTKQYIESGEFKEDVNKYKHVPMILFISGIIFTPIIFLYDMPLAIILDLALLFIGLGVNRHLGVKAEEKAREHDINYHDKRIIQSDIAIIGALGSMYFNIKKNKNKLFEDDSKSY
jgi:hypothetical protein